MTDTWQERERLKNLEAERLMGPLYPMLTLRSAMPKRSGAAMAAKNLVKLFKHTHPGVAVTCRSEYYANGSSVHLSFINPINAETPLSEKAANEMAKRFAYGTFDGSDDSYSYKSESDDEEGNAFRRAFGSAKYAFAQGRDPTLEEQQAFLDASTPAAPSKKKSGPRL